MVCARRVMLAAAAVLVTVAVQSGEPQFMVDMELWMDGEQHGEPMLLVEAGKPGFVEHTDADGLSGWRIELEVEKPRASEGAPDGALWLHVGVHRLDEGEWEHLADSILGVPEGQTATMSVVEGEVAQPMPDNSLVFLTASVSRLHPVEPD